MDNKSIRSAFNSHRPSTTNKINARLSQREEFSDTKQLDIENYLDHTIVDLSKNQI